MITKDLLLKRYFLRLVGVSARLVYSYFNYSAIRGKESAVGGLIWQPLTSLKRLKQESKQLIKKEQCDYFIIHQQNKKAQCGLVKSLPKQEQRYYSCTSEF